MRSLFSLVFKLVIILALLVVFTAAWVVLDGLTDLGERADVALVTIPTDESYSEVEKPLLDRVVKLYNEGGFPEIIVSGGRSPGGTDEPQAMAKYLTDKGIPPNAISNGGALAPTTQETARQVAVEMKARDMHSVMIITNYYHVTRVKLALFHEGVTVVQKAHVGKFQKEDAWEIGREIVALYDYVGRFYVLPTAEKVKEEAAVAIDKAKVDAGQAKSKVNNGLDSMSK